MAKHHQEGHIFLVTYLVSASTLITINAPAINKFYL